MYFEVLIFRGITQNISFKFWFTFHSTREHFIVVEANPQQENNFVFLSPFHSIFVIYTPSMLSERVSVSSCSEKETMCFVTR